MSNDVITGLSAEQFQTLANLAKKKEELTTQLIAVNTEMARITSGDAPVRVPRDKNRGEKIIEAIKAAGQDGVSVVELSPIVGASQPTISNWLRDHASEYPALVREQDGVRVRWVWHAAPSTTTVPTK